MMGKEGGWRGWRGGAGSVFVLSLGDGGVMGWTEYAECWVLVGCVGLCIM